MIQAQAPTRNASRLIVALAAIAGIILATLYVVSPARATHVTPSLVQGNASCLELNPSYDHEFKIQPVESGTFDDPNSDLVIELTVNNTADGQTVDWESNLPVDAVFVKGGPGGFLYVYIPGATSDTGTHAPGNDQGTAVITPPWAGLSHLSFCFNDVPESTPTPTPEGSVAQTATPTPEGSQAGGTGTPAPSVPNTALSLTGSGSLATIFFGAVLIASLGALAYANVTAVRRRR